MSMNAVTIDSTWISGAGSPPYVLSQANTVYTLATDVTVTNPSFNGPVFKLTGYNVELVMNGHVIRVNNLQYPQVSDSRVYRRESQHTVRANPDADVHTYGGTFSDGNVTKPVIDPSTPEYPPLIPYADTL